MEWVFTLARNMHFDTNVVLRLLLEDNKEQLKKARLIVKQNKEEGAVFISSVVFVEMYFVLTKLLEWSKDQVYQAFDKILCVKEFCIENELAIRMTLSDVRKKINFPDALIGQIGQARNVKTYTFDKDLKNDSAFIIL
jgi:predicted nucleic-acid-binding protein